MLPRIARRSGLIRAWRHFQRDRITILMAHGVMPGGAHGGWEPLWPRIDTAHFERTLALLKNHHEFITLEKAVDILSGRCERVDHGMVLTFDDGYRNNYTEALPILEKLAIPATFYVCSGMLEGGKAFWIDRLDYAIQKLPAGEHDFRVGGQTISLDFTSRATLAQTYQILRKTLKQHHGVEFESVIERICRDMEQRAGASILDRLDDDPWAGIMRWSEAVDATSRGIEIGSHTIDHLRLEFSDDDVVREQLTASRRTIGERLGTGCFSLAYPNGSFSGRTAQLAEQCGYGCALTTVPGFNDRGTDLFRLKRLSFPAPQSADGTLSYVAGLGLHARQWSRRLRRRL